MKNYKNILVDVRGGTGKTFAFISIAKELKEKYEHVSVITPYFDIPLSSAYVDKAYNPNEVRSAIEDAGEDTLIVIDHIYDTDAFIRKEISYQDAFRLACGLKAKDNKTGGTDAVSELNPEKAFPYLTQQKNEILKAIKDNGFEDFIIVQFTGSQSPLVQVPTNEKGQPDWSKVPYNGQNTGLSRHYPKDKADEFIRLFRAAHPKTAIINYNLPNEYQFEGVFQYTSPYLTYYMLSKLPECKGIVAIDSSLQHMVAGVVKAVVLWAHSLPDSFGYKYNTNVVQNCRRDGIKYFSALGPASNRVDYIKPEKLLDIVNDKLFGDGTKYGDVVYDK